jgi:hypothetical protein
MTMHHLPKSKALDPRKIRDIRPDVLGEDGRPRVLPAAYWASTSSDERSLFGVRAGIYSFPTVELVARLREIIGRRLAIEIGAGHGVLADALQIVSTDNCQQRLPEYRALYESNGWAIPPYGPKVIEIHASRAVRVFRPQVVIGCWCTPKLDPKCPEKGGNPTGVDELDVLRHCETYVLVGHKRVHQHSKIWEREPTVEFPDYVYSRAFDRGQDFIAVVKGLK